MMIQEPPQETDEAYAATFTSIEAAMGLDKVPHDGACRRCRKPAVSVYFVEIRYPSTIRHLELCAECKNEVMNVIDQALVEAGV